MRSAFQNSVFRITTLLSLALLAGCAAAPTVSMDALRTEMAPTGKVRVAVPGNNPNYLNLPSREPYSGVAVDLGNAIAKRLGLPVQVVTYSSISALLADAGSAWDVTLIGIEDSRRAVLEYSRPYATTPNSYLVPAGSGLKTIADVDRRGVRVAVSDATIQHRYLKSTLREASVVTTVNVSSGTKELVDGRAEALAANRSTVEDLAAKMPGYRVLPGSFYEVQYGVGVPKGRKVAAAHIDEVVREMRASGAMAGVFARAKGASLAVPSN